MQKRFFKNESNGITQKTRRKQKKISAVFFFIALFLFFFTFYILLLRSYNFALTSVSFFHFFSSRLRSFSCLLSFSFHLFYLISFSLNSFILFRAFSFSFQCFPFILIVNLTSLDFYLTIIWKTKLFPRVQFRRYPYWPYSTVLCASTLRES